MIIDNDSDSEQAVEEESADVAGTAYREAITSVDGFTRGPNGKIKFNKDTKKRRREEEAIQDIEMADPEEIGGNKSKKPKKKSDPAFGHEFKAKVFHSNIMALITIWPFPQKAGGDVKKGGVDPYAYLSLSQAAKSGGRGKKIGITGKRWYCTHL